MKHVKLIPFVKKREVEKFDFNRGQLIILKA
jgi:hypothetical protein